jgi:hypothetical protein
MDEFEQELKQNYNEIKKGVKEGCVIAVFFAIIWLFITLDVYLFIILCLFYILSYKYITTTFPKDSNKKFLNIYRRRDFNIQEDLTLEVKEVTTFDFNVRKIKYNINTKCLIDVENERIGRIEGIQPRFIIEFDFANYDKKLILISDIDFESFETKRRPIRDFNLFANLITISCYTIEENNEYIICIIGYRKSKIKKRSLQLI